MKVCSRCKREQPLDRFTPEKRNADGRMGICKDCRAAGARENWKDPEWAARSNAKRKEWHYKNYHMRFYGITREEFLAMLERQGNCCALCGSDKAGAGRDGQWAVDHCHKTNRIRGILCHNCNTALGYYERLMDTIGEAHLMRYLHPERPLSLSERVIAAQPLPASLSKDIAFLMGIKA